MASLTFWPAILQATTFSAYIGTGHTIDIATAYTLITVFNLISQPLRMLPMFIGNCVEFSVSMRRIQKFLTCEELNPMLIDQKQHSAINAIEVRDNANFHWGIKPEEDKSTEDHKKALKARKQDKKKVKKEEKKQNLLAVEEEEKNGSGNSLSAERFRSVERERENMTVEKFMALKHMNLQIRKGEFVCIIGDVGSGKSSLLSSLIGDMLYVNENFINSYGEAKVNI